VPSEPKGLTDGLQIESRSSAARPMHHAVTVGVVVAMYANFSPSSVSCFGLFDKQPAALLIRLLEEF